MLRRQDIKILCCASAFFLIMLFILPSAAHSLPQGNGSLSLFHRYSRQDSSTSVASTLNESLLRIDLYQIIPGYGGLFSSLDFSRTDSSLDSEHNSLSRYQIGIEGFHLGKWTSAFITGDTSIRFTNLDEGFSGPFPSLLPLKPLYAAPFSPEAGRFLNTSYPEVNFRGGAMSSVTGKDSLLLFGGRMATTTGFQSNAFNFSNETLYGVKWAHQWSPNFYAGVGIAQTHDQERITNLSRTTLNNTVFLLDGAYRLNDSVKFIGEYKENLFTQDGEYFADRAFKIGPVITLKKLALEANYRYTGPNFVFFRENLQPEQDTEGFFVAVQYKPRDYATIFTSFDWNRNNLNDNRALVAVNSLSANIGSYFFLPPLPAMSLRFGVTDRTSRETSSTPVDTRSYAVNLDVTKQFKALTPYLRFQGDLTTDKVALENSATSGSMTAGLRVFPAVNLNFYLEGEEQVRTTDKGTTTGTFNARGGVSLVALTGLNLYVDANYAVIKEKQAGTSLETISTGSGANIVLPAQFYLNGDVRYSSNMSRGASTGEFSNLQISVGLTKRFGWGMQGASLLPGQAGRLSLSEVGDIEGYVFQDLNQNGVKDGSEPGIAGISVLLEDNSKAVTDADGRYMFKNVATGIHQVRVNERELPATYNLLGSPSQRIELLLRGTGTAHFPLLLSGAIKGKILIDTNENGVADEGDAPLPDILIFLNGTKINTFSDGDGNFVIENLLPGKYDVKLDQTGLAEDMKLISPPSYPIVVNSGDELKIQPFLVAVEKKHVIKKVFPSKSAIEAPVPPCETASPVMNEGSILELSSAPEQGGVIFTPTIEVSLTPLATLGLEVELPRGLVFRRGSATRNGHTLADPEMQGKTLAFNLGAITHNRKIKLRFAAEFAAEAPSGKYLTRAALNYTTDHGISGRTPYADNIFARIREEERHVVPAKVVHPKFRTFDDQLTGEVRTVLDEKILMIRNLKESGILKILHLLLVGHTDNVRIAKRSRQIHRDNMALSKARARSVASYLIKQLGLAPEQISVSGKGETSPVASNRTAEGRALNRRVEIIILNDGAGLE